MSSSKLQKKCEQRNGNEANQKPLCCPIRYFLLKMTQHAFGANKQFSGHFLEIGQFLLKDPFEVRKEWSGSWPSCFFPLLFWGLCGQSIALIKGVLKRQLKSTGSGLWEGGEGRWRGEEGLSNFPTALSASRKEGMWWVIEPSFSLSLGVEKVRVKPSDRWVSLCSGSTGVETVSKSSYLIAPYDRLEEQMKQYLQDLICS